MSTPPDPGPILEPPPQKPHAMAHGQFELADVIVGVSMLSVFVAASWLFK